MRNTITCLCGVIFLSAVLSATSLADDRWSQFRGPNCSGHAGTQPSLPTEFGPEENVLWKCPLPRGLSSPCIRGDRIYLTAFDSVASGFKVFCVGREDGAIVWQADVEAETIEKVHKASSPANATAVADEECVYVYFASCGIFCFDRDGKQVWEHRLPVSNRFNGSGTSPVLAGDRLILNREDDKEKYLLAVGAKTGETIWKQTHGGGGQSFGEATPVIWNDQAVLHRHYEVAAFDLADGRRGWSVPLRTTAASTPVIENDVLYVAAWNNFGEDDLRGQLPSFAKILNKHDKDNNGQLSREEMPWGPALARRPELDGRGLGGNIPIKFMFGAVDTNRDGNVDETEWNKVSDMTAMMVKGAEHGMTAIRLTKQDRRVETETLWEHSKSVPEVPSPLVVGNHVYMIKNGGILTCFDKQTGDVAYRRRLKATGPYIASPITVNDQIIAASADGVVTIFQAGETFDLTSTCDMKEPIMATPAIADGVLYIRTDKALYAFARRTD